MRTLCGAIITAGALIGLGLTALAFGLRFEGLLTTHESPGFPKEGQLVGIPSMEICLVVLLICVLVGLGISFLGLMFHHERRHFELHGRSELGHIPRTEPTGRVM